MALAPPEVDLGVELLFQELEDIEPGCEHTEHEDDPSHHSGPAMWVLTYPPTACGCPAITKLVCDKWKKFVISPRTAILCQHPGYIMSQDEKKRIKFEPIRLNK